MAYHHRRCARRAIQALGAAVFATIAQFSLVQGSAAQTLATQLITDDVVEPVEVTHAPGDITRLFILERGGRVRLVKNGTLLATPFLDITPLVSTNIDGGLLGMDFHPEYDTNGHCYIRYNDEHSRVVIARYTRSANPDVLDPNSAHLIFMLPQANLLHNGGTLEFGPDGYLYTSLGDGFDFDNAQNTSDVRGKILRIDVSGADDFPADPNKNYAIPPDNPFKNEVWAYGLRNPFRAAFDHETGNLLIGDVGEVEREEINLLPAGQSGVNFGWPCMEGTQCFDGPGCTCNAPSLRLPAHEYSHGLGCSVTGGRVYRGCAIPELQGTYFFADYCSWRVWSAQISGNSLVNVQQRQGELNPPNKEVINYPVAIGEDALGELYICDITGEVYKIVPATPAPDVNNNGIPDSCDRDGDVTGDGEVNVDDLLAVIAAWGPCGSPCPPTCLGDIAPQGGNCQVNVDDLLGVISNWG